MHVGSIQFRMLGVLFIGAICSLIACSGGSTPAPTGGVPPPATLAAPVITAPAVALLGSQNLAARVSASQSGVTYTWTVIGGAIIGTAIGPSVIFSADQIGILTLTCQAAMGDQRRSATAQVVIQGDLPQVPHITAPTTVTAGAAGLKSQITAPESGTTYAWSILDGAITGGVNTSQVTFTAGVVGTLSLTCIATNQVGSTSAIARIQVLASVPDPSVYTVLASIDGTGLTDVTAALNNWIATVPNGTAANPSVIRFPSGNTYLVSQGIQISNRTFLTFDGYGARIKLNPAAGFSQLQSLFLLGKAYNGFFGGINKNIIIKGFDLEASNPTPGIWAASREMAHAVEIDNSDGVEVFDVTAHGIGGDGFKITDGHNLHLHHNHILDAGRQGVSVISGDQILIDNNQFDDMGYFILDIEPNNDTESATDITFRDNIAGSWGPNVGVGAGFVACGSGTAYNRIGNITVTGNTMTGMSDASLRSYFNQNAYKRLYNIVFTNNKATQADSGPVLIFKSIDGLTVTGNAQPVSSGTLSSIQNSTSVVSSPNP